MNSFHHRAKRFGVILNPSRVGSSPIANSRLRPIDSSLLTLTFSAGRAACELARPVAIRVPEPFVGTTLSAPGSLKEVEDILWSLASRCRPYSAVELLDIVFIADRKFGLGRPGRVTSAFIHAVSSRSGHNTVKTTATPIPMHTSANR